MLYIGVGFVLSVQACSGAMASSYFGDAKENYYTRDQSATDEWQGNLCEKIGLQDGAGVRAEDFQIVVSTRDTKCAGYDCTFSAPKSVSIVSQLGNDQQRQDMIDAHREAVRDTLQEIEKNEIYTRARIDGKITHIKTGEMAAAKFEHNLSRNLDPQLHTHAYIANLTEYNGQIYAVDGSRLYNTQKIYGAEYRARLAGNLRARGYEIEITDPGKGFFELKDMKDEDLEVFSTRRAEILADMEARGVSGAEAAQVSTLATRHVKERDIDQEKLRQEWRETWGDRTLADRSADPLPDTDTAAAQRAAYAEAVESLEAKSYAWTAKEFEEEITKNGVSCGMTREQARELINEDPAIMRGELEKPNSDEPKQYFSTIKNYEQEKALFESVAEGRGEFSAALDHKTAERTRAEVCEKNDWKLTEQQENLVSHIAESKDNIIAVRGLAGVGKSYSLNVAREVLEENGYEVMGAAPSGQAAKELAEDAGMEGQTTDGATRCGTLQRIMNEAERSAGNADPGQDYENKRSWNFENIKAPGRPRVYLLDEAGMIDNNSMSEFFKMADAQRAAGAEIKIVLVGDDCQLPPVGAGNFFSDAIQRDAIAKVELTDIRRQTDAPELLQAVREAVQGSPEKSLEILADEKAIHEVKTPKGRTSAIVKEYMSMSDAERGKTLILSAKNADRIKINDAIRGELVKAGKVEQGKEYRVEVKKGAPPQTRSFSPGDKIIFLKNDIRAGVRNGAQGVIAEIKGNNFTVKTAAGKTVNIDITKYNCVDHAYCVTTYKSQGATVDRVIVNMNSADKALNTRNAYYVDVSRAKGKVSLYCDNKTKIGQQVQHFAKKLTGKDFNFARPAVAAPIRVKGATAAAKPAKIVGGAGKAAGKAVESVAALIPPIPIVAPLLKAAAKVAAIAAETVEIAMKPLEMAAGAVKSAAEAGIKAGMEADKPIAGQERGRVLKCLWFPCLFPCLLYFFEIVLYF